MSGDRARVKRITFSPVLVLISWCMVTTLTPVTFSIIAAKIGRAVSTRWVRTSFSKSRPFSAGSDLANLLLGYGQNALKTHDDEIAEQIGVDVFGAPAHVILLEATNPLADGSFDLSQSPHRNRL